MRKAVIIFLMVICAALMAGIWPIGIVRREREVQSAVSEPYQISEQAITCDACLEQSFVAQTDKLDSVCFALHLPEGKQQQGVLLFEFLDARDKVLHAEPIVWERLGNCTFYEVPIEQWIKKGQVYRIRLSVDADCEGFLGACYTDREENHAPGSRELRLGESVLPGQALMRYTYGFRLNLKNVVCIWAFLLTICFSFCGRLEKGEREHGEA